MLVQGARLVVDRELLIVDGELLVVNGSCSDISLLDGAPYIHIQYSSSSSSL